jgi:release factor glutamine methyltransferase
MELYLNFDDLVPEEKISEIRNMIVQRGRRIPLQHILESVQFCDLRLKCDRRALIPRPETERLVEIIIESVGEAFNGNILDLGSGTGAIVLALCNQLKEARGLGMDKSSEAIDLSRENLCLLDLSARVSFQKFDWMLEEYKQEKVDLLISNPPYLSLEEWNTAEPEVNKHDPKDALVSPEGGLAHLRKLLDLSTSALKKDGQIFIEVGMGQAEKVMEMMKDIFYDIQNRKDFCGVRRYVFARFC